MDQFKDFFLVLDEEMEDTEETYTFEDCFLELEEEDTEEPCKCEWPCKCEFEWDPVKMRSVCWECVRAILRPIDDSGGDFDAWSSGRLYGKVQRLPQPQCPAKTIRGHQCTHPCQPRKDLCLRHLNVSRKRDPYKLCDTFMCNASLRGVRTIAIGRSHQRLWAFEPSLRGVRTIAMGRSTAFDPINK